MYRLNFIIRDLQYTDTNIAGVGGHVCYFRLSVVAAIIWVHFPWTRDGRKP